MKIDFSKQLLDHEGKPAKTGDGKDVTVATVSTLALLSTNMADTPNGEEKGKRFALWMRVKDGGEVELDVDEAKLLKTVTGIHTSILYMGQVWEMLNKS